MTLGTFVAATLGLALGLLGPRWGRPLLAAFFALLVALGLAWRAGVGGWTFLGAAFALVLVEAAGVWLAVRRPRVALVPALLFSLLVGVVPLLFGTGSRPSPASLVLGAACLLLAIGGVVRPALGIRLAAAAVGARLFLAALPGETAGWQWPVLAAGLLTVGTAISRRAELPRGSGRLSARAGGGAAVFSLLACAAVALLTPELPSPDAAGAPRLQRLQALAPRGGYLWPALSETVTWEDATGYRLWDNLNARYLTGTDDRGLFLLPGSSRLRGRFSLNQDVERLRAIKDADELQALQAAATAIVTAVRAVAPGRTPGVSEQAVADAIKREARAAGCSEDSFPPVVAGGARGASIHASASAAPLRTGELLVVDVGCSVHHYASDFTRTFPVGGHFSEEQRRDYEAVYAAQQAAAAACRPGAVISGKAPDGSPSLDAVAHRVLQERLSQKGFNHGLGHGVGLFVHDVGSSGPLQPGMVITLEPGLYLPGKLGIRIEDTYRVTDSGCIPLTRGLSAEPTAVEAFLAGAPSAAETQRVAQPP